MNKSTVILIAVIVIVLLFVGSTYNNLVAAQQKVQESWAQVENVYQRRADLVPNLVVVVAAVLAAAVLVADGDHVKFNPTTKS